MPIFSTTTDAPLLNDLFAAAFTRPIVGAPMTGLMDT